MREFHALLWLTLTLIRRLLRYGMILRSLSFPAALISLTLVLTVAVISWTRPPPVLVVTPQLYSQDLATALDVHDIVLTAMKHRNRGCARVAPPVQTAIRFGFREPRKPASRLKSRRPDIRIDVAAQRPILPAPETIHELGALIVRLLLGIFALYGAVFGTAMVARDREDGSLELDCTLPVHRWVHGAS